MKTFYFCLAKDTILIPTRIIAIVLIVSQLKISLHSSNHFKYRHFSQLHSRMWKFKNLFVSIQKAYFAYDMNFFLLSFINYYFIFNNLQKCAPSLMVKQPLLIGFISSPTEKHLWLIHTLRWVVVHNFANHKFF